MKRFAAWRAAWPILVGCMIFPPPASGSLTTVVAPTGQEPCTVSAISENLDRTLACRVQIVATRQGVTYRPNVQGGRTVASRWVVDGHDLVTGVRGRNRTFGRRGDLRVSESNFGPLTIHARSLGPPITVMYEWEVGP